MAAKLDHLPNELLYQILGDVPYWDLHLSVPKVCKRLRAPIHQPHRGVSDLDIAMFRDIPKYKRNPNTKRLDTFYLPHPAFKLLHYMRVDPVEKAELQYAHKPGRERLIDSPVCSENAISPAVRRLYIRHPEYFPQAVLVEGTGVNGSVSVLDIVSAVEERFRYLRYIWWIGTACLWFTGIKGTELNQLDGTVVVDLEFSWWR